MRKVWRSLPLAIVACGARQSRRAQAPSPDDAVEFKVGDQAPDFTLPATDGKTYTLSKDLRGTGSCWRGSRKPSPLVERLNATRSVRAGD